MVVLDDVAAVNAQLSNGDVRHLGRVSRGAVRLAAKGLRASAGPRRTPSRFAPCALGLGKCRQELSRQESTLQYDVYNSAGLSDFLSPLNRLLAIIERLLPASIKADFIPCHGRSRLPRLFSAIQSKSSPFLLVIRLSNLPEALKSEADVTKPAGR